jgi:hypothetical protein
LSCQTNTREDFSAGYDVGGAGLEKGSALSDLDLVKVIVKLAQQDDCSEKNALTLDGGLGREGGLAGFDCCVGGVSLVLRPLGLAVRRSSTDG